MPTRLTIDQGKRGYRYYRNAVERHWDPGEIDLSRDVDALETMYEEQGEQGRFTLAASLALFGAGEEAVTEDLSPLAEVLGDIEDQLFITTQLYEEAKHTDFFDRYWREVIHEFQDRHGLEKTYPTEDRWFSDGYDELFERNERAMARLLEEDTPENRVRAYAHYHLTIEGILAQTGYWGLTKNFNGEREDLEALPGLVEGIKQIRSDEGRHVGFGMSRVKQYVESGEVDFDVVEETINELIPLVQEGVTHVFDVSEAESEEMPGMNPDDIEEYAFEKHLQRMEQISNVDESVPDVTRLTALDD